jgi:hypothetical protein
MPYVVSVRTLPSGPRYLHVVGSGVINKTDAEYLLSFVGEAGSMAGVPFLVMAEKMESVSPEARSRFNGGDPQAAKAWSGIVVTNPVARVITRFMLRFKNRSQKVKIFSTEAEALRWLDERVREDAARAGS